jgi:hypothetical protein
MQTETGRPTILRENKPIRVAKYALSPFCNGRRVVSLTITCRRRSTLLSPKFGGRLIGLGCSLPLMEQILANVQSLRD